MLCFCSFVNRCFKKMNNPVAIIKGSLFFHCVGRYRICHGQKELDFLTNQGVILVVSKL